MLLGTCPRAVVLCLFCALSGFMTPGGRRCLAPVRVCVCSSVLAGVGGPASRASSVRLTFSFDCFVFPLCLAPSRLGLPPSWSFDCPDPPLLCFFSSLLLFFAPPLCLLLSLVSSPALCFVFFVSSLCALALFVCPA